MEASKHTPVIVLTGGPCGGKSTALCYLEEKLRDRGYIVFLVPEAATTLIQSGIRPKGSGLTFEEFEEAILKKTLRDEEFYRESAEISRAEKKIIICDRGIMDIRAYMEEEQFHKLIGRHGFTIVELRDKRYDGVFHLRTVAFGKEELYRELWESNPARVEKDPRDAREQDEKTLHAWIGCPHLRIIDNSTDFEGKLKRIFKHVCRVVGIPVPLEIERKFLVETVDPRQFPVPVQEIDIEQAYLKTHDDNEEERIRKRGQNGTYVYYRTTKRMLRPGVRPETERHISAAEYRGLLQCRDPSFNLVVKKRYCFVWKEQYFEFDIFNPHCAVNLPPTQALLEIELTEENDEVEIPHFIDVIREATGEEAFSNRELARIMP